METKIVLDYISVWNWFTLSIIFFVSLLFSLTIINEPLMKAIISFMFIIGFTYSSIKYQFKKATMEDLDE